VRDESGNTATERGNRTVFPTRPSRRHPVPRKKSAHHRPGHAIETLSRRWELRNRDIADVVVTETWREGKAPT